MIINEGDLVLGAKVNLKLTYYEGPAIYIGVESLEHDGIRAKFSIERSSLKNSTYSADYSSIIVRIHYGYDYGVNIINIINDSLDNDSLDLEAYYREVLEG
jgi:hypothetical protein